MHSGFPNGGREKGHSGFHIQIMGGWWFPYNGGGKAHSGFHMEVVEGCTVVFQMLVEKGDTVVFNI